MNQAHNPYLFFYIPVNLLKLQQHFTLNEKSSNFS
jgi:hypothetical protein